MPLDPFVAHSNLPGHHPDCDGFRMHSREAVNEGHPHLWSVACPLCGPLPMVGKGGSPDTALAMAPAHAYFEECDGRCLMWD